MKFFIKSLGRSIYSINMEKHQMYESCNKQGVFHQHCPAQKESRNYRGSDVENRWLELVSQLITWNN